MSAPGKAGGRGLEGKECLKKERGGEKRGKERRESQLTEKERWGKPCNRFNSHRKEELEGRKEDKVSTPYVPERSERRRGENA